MKLKAILLTLKQQGGGNLTPPVVFPKMYPSKERLNPWFFMTINIIISHIFPENFIEIPQVVQKI